MAVNFPSNPTNGQTITVSGITYAYDSTQGVWSDSPQGLTQAIDALTDVDTSTVAPTNGQVLQWNSTDSEWQPADSSAGVTVYATIDDLPLSGVAEGSMALVDSTDKLYIFSDAGWYSITLVNTTPSISGVNATYTLATDGTATVVTVTATDPEGLPLTYSIVSDTSGNVATVTQGTGANTNQWTITPSTNSANAGNFTLVFRASDGVNIASASSTFELKFQVVNSHYTTALITAADNGYTSNKVFRDSSGNNHTITANGDAAQSTFSPYRHGGYSTYFDGTGDWVDTPNNADFYLDGEFTVEFWVYLNQASYARTIQRVIAPNSGAYVSAPYISIGNDTGINGGAQAGVLCATQIISGGNPQVYANTTGTSATGTPVTVPLNKWVHCALSRDSSNNVRLWQEGVLVGTFSNSSVFDFTYGSTVGARIGRSGWGASETLGPAYLRDFRIVKGTALYTGTSSFDPPTKPITAVTNTKLLFCHLPYIKDGSTSDHALTVSGDTKTEPFGPYDYSEYSASVSAGSAYFDGTGDYLSVGGSSNNESLSGDFCIEAWIYPTGTNDGTILGNYATNPNRGWSIRSFTSNNLYLYFQIDGGSQIVYQTASNSVNPNEWNHVVWCRSGTNTSVFINGKRADNRTLSGTAAGAGGVAVGMIGQSYLGFYFTGYIADARIVNGSAVYDPSQTTLTVPTAPLTAISGTRLLLPFDDATIIDKSQTSETLTLFGNTTISATQTKHLNYSMYFDGTGDYIDIVPPSSEFFNFGTADFTAEFWMYLTNVSGEKVLLESRAGHTDAGLLIMLNTGVMKNLTAGAVRTTGGTTIAADTWYHVAVVRDSTSLRTYLNGTEESGSASYTSAITAPASKFRLGARFDGANPPAGYFSDVRITKGLARYTSNFTPPSAALEG